MVFSVGRASNVGHDATDSWGRSHLGCSCVILSASIGLFAGVKCLNVVSQLCMYTVSIHKTLLNIFHHPVSRIVSTLCIHSSVQAVYYGNLFKTTFVLVEQSIIADSDKNVRVLLRKKGLA